MMLVDERKARKTSYYNLPAFTSYVTPVAMGISNMGTPKALWERGVAQTFTATVAALNAATETAPPSVDLTITAHGLTDGTQVIAFNFSELTFDISDLWYIHAVDANTIRLLGCAAQDSGNGDAVGSTGVISTSNEDYPTVPNVEFKLELQPIRTLTGTVSQASWVDGAFRFIPPNADRQLKILYTVSGTPPTNLEDSIGIDNSMEFLACYGAALSANALGVSGIADRLFTMAVGNASGDPGNGDAGFLGQFLRPQIRTMQNERIICLPFRTKRNTGWWIPF